MILFKKANALTSFLTQCRKEGRLISFVPTMGALHKGHISLIEGAKGKADLAVCSIFVNPTQFNNPDDFSKYPVTLEKDIEKLVSSGCDVLFLPGKDEIYPPSYNAPYYDLGLLETVLEGYYRPGHFQGVCQVVDRLLQIVQPDFLFLGQKDYQQCRVVQRLIELTGKINISLVIFPTIREKDGLAMSSRNLRLSNDQRAIAPAIYEALQKAINELSEKSFAAIKEEATRFLTGRGFRVDYFEIADAATLLPATAETRRLVLLVAAYLGEIRLIDNHPLN